MSDHPDIGEISAAGRRYLDGKLQGSQLSGEFELSREGDIPSLEKIDQQQRESWGRIGREVLPGKVAFGVLAAGASSRMALKDLPDNCKQMLQASGENDLPSSKALVPVYMDDSANPPRVLNFLDLFLINATNVRRQFDINNPVLMLSSEANGDEIDRHLRKVDAENVLVFRQPMAPQIAATPDDVQRAEKNFRNESDLAQAHQRAAEWSGREVLIGKPAGHGEFLHQLVASGMLGRLAELGVEYFSVRNIDNVAALINDDWLTLLGYAVEQDLDCLLEVCPRLPGQKGGALIRQSDQWRIAEDPSFVGTGRAATESCYINNAVAIFRLSYLYKLYETTAAKIKNATTTELAETADVGRARFPVIVEAKPVKLSDSSVVAAVTPETNLWESTGVVQGAKIGAFAVPSERAVGSDFLEQDAQERAALAKKVRFSPTKTWADFQDPLKRAILVGITQNLLDGD